MQPWTAKLAAMILEHLNVALDLPAWTPQALAALRAPLDRYGLGITSLNQEAILCQLAGTLALQTLDGDQVVDNAWRAAFQAAAAQCEIMTGTTVGRALDLSEDELTLGVAHAMPKLRERLHVCFEFDLVNLLPMFTRFATPPALSHEVKPADVVWSATAWWASLLPRILRGFGALEAQATTSAPSTSGSSRIIEAATPPRGAAFAFAWALLSLNLLTASSNF